jgi:hypothetical protein
LTTQTSLSSDTDSGKSPQINAQKKKVGAIVLAAFLVGIGIIVFIVGGIGAIFMTDSCSGVSIGTVWEIWVVVVWPLLMLIGSLLPAFLYLKNKRWPVIVLAILGCAIINTVWYFSLGFVLTAAGC